MPQSNHQDVYLEITTKIIADLETGIVPWVQPWNATKPAVITLPKNISSGQSYSGINILLLWSAAVVRGYTSHEWLTYKQAEAFGGRVRRGERGTSAVYADRFVPNAEKQRAFDANEAPNAIPFLKRFTVFNRDQVDGLPVSESGVQPLAKDLIDPVVRRLIQQTGVGFQIGGGEAFYAPAADYIQVPPPDTFHEPINWHRTALHELSHATGHKTRLDRDLTGRFGSSIYAFEELIAEISAAFCCASLGFAPTVRHADYIGSWLTVLRNDKRAILKAASQASKASDWLLQFAE